MKVVRKSFELMNQAKRDSRLRGNEYRVYQYLLDMAHNDTAECYVLHATVAGDLGIHVDTVRRTMNKLVSKGFILKQLVKHKYTYNNSANLYTICGMLDEQSLMIKKKMIELFPVIRKGVNKVEDMIKVAIENLYPQDEIVVETTEEIVEDATPEVEEATPVFEPSFQPRYTLDGQSNVADEEVEEVEEVIQEEDFEDDKLSFKDRVFAMFKNDFIDDVEELLLYAERYDVVVSFKQMKSLVHRFDMSDIKKAIVRAYASEINHFNYVRSYLESNRSK